MEKNKERVFSVELKSKNHLKNLTLSNNGSECILLEGSIGELIEATFKEGIILEVIGQSGILRVDLQEREVTKALQKTAVEVEQQ